MKFSQLAAKMQEIEGISSTIAIRKILAELIKKLPKSEISQATLILAGGIAPEAKDLKIGMSSKLVIKAIAKTTKKSVSEVAQKSKELGDVGLAAEFFGKKRSSTLSIKQVYDGLRIIARESGSGSIDKKVNGLANLFKKASKKESKYLARIVTGKLRLGSGKLLILDALAMALTKDIKNRKDIERAYNVSPNMGELAYTLKTQGIRALKQKKASFGKPIKPMLAQRAKTITDISSKMGLMVAEEKFDGERIQAHKNNNQVVLFSRRLENITHQFPEVAGWVQKQTRVKKCILDGEVVPTDKKGNLLPFQILMQRRRKHNVQEYQKEIPVKYFVFDILKKENTSLLKMPFLQRRKELKKAVKPTKNIQLAKQIKTRDIKKVKKFFDKTIKEKKEGIIVKSGDKNSIYRAGSRGWLWIKWKKDYVKGLYDSLDLVIVGAYKGRGKRAGMYGALLCAAYNKKTKTYETVCKLGTGLKDKDLKELPKKLRKFEVVKQPKKVSVTKAMKPDVWFKPSLVIEVEGAELTRSPSHTCAKEKTSGLSLRFPRFIRYRPDKSAAQATTTKEVKDMQAKR